MGLVWRITRHKLSGHWASLDIDPFEVPSDQGATPQSVRVAEVPALMAKKLKMGTGQPDEEETPDKRAITGIERESDRSIGFSLRSRFHTLRPGKQPELIVSPLTSLSRTALGWRKKSLVQPVGTFSVWHV